MELKERFARRFGEHWLDDKERYKFTEITDIPIMFGLDGGIICIPNKVEVSNIGIVGHRGTGKTLLAHRIIDELFWLLKKNVTIMNDSLEETFEWCLTQNNPDWNILLENIEQTPCALPIIYVYPNSSTLITNINNKEKSYVKISLPFSELIENNEEYMKLDRSAIYLRKLKLELLECKTVDEVKNLLESEEAIPNNASRHKIITAFENIFAEEILNITDIEIPDELSLNKKYTSNPFSVIMKAGCIPSFITSDLYMRRYKAQIFAYYINLLFQNQLSRDFLDEDLYIYFDEITKICSTNEENAARTALEQIPTRARQLRIGLIYCTQNYEKVPRLIQSNTDYVFAFRHSNKKEVSTISSDFDVTPSIETEILNLKKFECIGLTTDYFVIYYPNGTVKPAEGPIVGRIIPPISRHKKPK